ncbi:alpha/beta hydrolase fold domain-containing protein [Brachybacterium squillarum]|uniref:alpha/beta hydrolase fold domain-containing protein n=1 Tax=Brachybacterium squillarum TaxID=661979 RepID=UPI0002629893|nr:alpha/beta hydrolase fold domain-containing protein [Brachybacterium squillarum]
MSIGILGALGVLASQTPTRPSRAVARPSRVRRVRHAHIPVTWIDQDKARTATVVHLHGGSYLRGEQPRHWTWLEELGRRADVATAMVHYRMPPRHPFPQGLDDVLAVLDAMERENLLPPGRWVLSGDEAGAALALGAAQTLADRGDLPPALLLLAEPWGDLRRADSLDSERRQAARMYVDGLPQEDPRLSPALAPPTALPPVHLSVGGRSPLLPEARAVASRIEEGGGEVTLHEEAAGGEDFPVVAPDATAQRVWRSQIAAVRAAVGQDRETSVGA